MSDPRIQYTRTADGVNIAFWTIGAGPALVSMPNIPWSHILMEWQTPELRALFQRLAHSRTLIRYDGRGTGLSDRNVEEFSVASHCRDLAAVADHLKLDRFELLAPGHSGPPAIAFAAENPDRVSRLALWCTYATGADYLRHSRQLAATRLLLDRDWEMYTETVAHATWGWSSGEQARRFASFIRESVGVDIVNKVREAIDSCDVSASLPKLRCPTLVAHRRGFAFPSPEAARSLASQIPEARLVLLAGSSPAPFLDDVDAVVDALGEFFGTEFGRAAAEKQPSGQQGAPVTILFTDCEDSTALTQRHGDEKGQEMLHVHNRAVRDALRGHGGVEVKHTGDGIMASFASASRAAAAAIAIQRTLSEHTEANPASPVRVRIGLNAGEPVAEEGDIFGSSVQLAARVCARAEPGQILASDVVRQLAAGKGFLWSDTGEHALKGFEEPVRLYQLRW